MVQRTQQARQRYWLFQFRLGDDISDVRRGREGRWQARKEMAPEDLVVLWKPGSDAGAFGFGKVTSAPENKKFLGHVTSVLWRCTRRLRVRLAKGDLSRKVRLRTIPVVVGKGFGAGVFKISAQQWKEFNALAVPPLPSSASMATQKQNEIAPRRYWLFQAHPRGDDLRDFLKGARPGDSFSWRIPHYTNPEEHMRAGDGAVLWQSPGMEPRASGVYALGLLTGQFPARGREAEFKLRTIRKLDSPISTKSLRQDPRLRDLAVLRLKGVQGPCFKIKDRQQWAAFVDAWGTVTEESAEAGIIRVVSLPVQVPHVSQAEVERDVLSYVSERREAEMVLEYAKYLERKGSLVERRAFIIGKERIECDLFDKTRRNLIEAKGFADRIAIRMAIGQLADYSRHFKPKLSLAVLVPMRPSDDLIALLSSQRISAVWRSKGQFKDNANDRFT